MAGIEPHGRLVACRSENVRSAGGYGESQMNLQNKTIVITGGAQGLGLEMARMCAAEGAKLALIDMNADQLAAAKAVAEGVPPQ